MVPQWSHPGSTFGSTLIPPSVPPWSRPGSTLGSTLVPLWFHPGWNQVGTEGGTEGGTDDEKYYITVARQELIKKSFVLHYIINCRTELIM